MTQTTRREFLQNTARVAAGVTLVSILPGCEAFKIDGSLNLAEPRFLTPANEWFWYSYAGFEPRQSPRIPADEYSLDVLSGGRSVGEITYRKLIALDNDGFGVNYLKTMRCVRGAYASSITQSLTATGVFRGIPLLTALNDTSISGEASKLLFTAFDGFTSSILFSRVLDEAQLPVILAFELNGRPIPPERGGPVRLIVPEMWAFKSVKWLTSVDATTDASSFGHFETQEGLPNEADSPGLMALMALSQNPNATRLELPGPTIDMHGMALVGGARITAVEIVVDGGEPVFATIAPIESVLESLGHDALLVQSAAQFSNDYPYADVWAPWSYSLDLEPGAHTVVIRAIDSNGMSNPNITADQAIIAQEISVELEVT